MLCQTVLILESGKWKVNCKVMWNEENQPKRLSPIRRDKQELAGRGKALFSPFFCIFFNFIPQPFGKLVQNRSQNIIFLSNTLQENTRKTKLH